MCHYPGHPAPVAVPLTIFPDHPCSYLSDRVARMRGFVVRDMPGGVYHRFMDAGFRRSGCLIYQPVCGACRECVPLRVAIETFHASKSQRRCWRRNQDLDVSVSKPQPNQEKFALYQRYMAQWHGRSAEVESDDAWETFTAFLYDSPVDSLEYCYRDQAGTLLAVGICDVCPKSLSSVYFYHDPSQYRRGLGTFGALHEIERARDLHIPHYYLGYWINSCATMEYKAGFGPCEVLHPDGIWRVLARAEQDAGID